MSLFIGNESCSTQKSYSTWESCSTQESAQPRSLLNQGFCSTWEFAQLGSPAQPGNLLHLGVLVVPVLAFVLAAFCWTKSLICNVAAFTWIMFYSESKLQLWASRRLCEEFKSVSSVPLHPSGRCCILFGRSSVSNIRPDDENFSSGRPSVFRSFEQFKIASIWTLFRVREDPSVLVNPSGRHGYTVRTPFSVWQVLGFLPQDTVIGRWLKPSGRCPP
jgi:hypothetical protein